MRCVVGPLRARSPRFGRGPSNGGFRFYTEAPFRFCPNRTLTTTAKITRSAKPPNQLPQAIRPSGLLYLSELDLPVDCNPDSTTSRKKVPFFTEKSCLGVETPTFSPGLPGCHDASFTRMRPAFNSC